MTEEPKKLEAAESDDMDDRLALQIGRLIRSCSFVDYYIDMIIHTSFPARNQNIAKILLNGVGLNQKIVALTALLDRSKTKEAMAEWVEIRKELTWVFEQRDLTAHGVFGRRVADDIFQVFRTRTGKSGAATIPRDHGIADIEAANVRANAVVNRLVRFLFP
ncbi:MAG: hypothetical protein WAS21_15230 [Geminicoccaceae bacterium]